MQCFVCTCGCVAERSSRHNSVWLMQPHTFTIWDGACQSLHHAVWLQTTQCLCNSICKGNSVTVSGSVGATLLYISRLQFTPSYRRAFLLFVFTWQIPTSVYTFLTARYLTCQTQVWLTPVIIAAFYWLVPVPGPSYYACWFHGQALVGDLNYDINIISSTRPSWNISQIICGLLEEDLRLKYVSRYI